MQAKNRRRVGWHAQLPPAAQDASILAGRIFSDASFGYFKIIEKHRVFLDFEVAGHKKHRFLLSFSRFEWACIPDCEPCVVVHGTFEEDVSISFASNVLHTSAAECMFLLEWSFCPIQACSKTIYKLTFFADR